MERLLIVEDSATQREMLRHTLVSRGHEVLAAVDGVEALKRLPEFKPTVVITDILMPNMDGYALCRAIKADPQFSRLPVILLTSLSDSTDVIAALECRADGFVGKPFNDEDLLNRLAAVTANRDLAGRHHDDGNIEIAHAGRTHVITTDRRPMLELLLSVYDVAMRRNADLATAQANLRRLNQELERKVRDRTRELEESNRALEIFCYSVAHDLRAPLRSIQGYVGMLLEHFGTSDPIVTSYVQRARQAGERMDAMIVDLLAYGRVSHAENAVEPVALREEVERVVAEFAADIERKSARVTIDVPAATIRTGRVLLAQILSNLLSNALKFVRPDAAPRVLIKAEVSPARTVIRVSDEGIGMDLAYREKLFRVFERLHNDTYPGTGIGLAIVHKAVERLGGSVSVESERNRGSTFTVELPGSKPDNSS